MPKCTKQHILGIDDSPLDKYKDDTVLVVGVVMAGSNLVEGILSNRLPIDGPAASEVLANWVNQSRFHPILKAIFLDGITIAGLSVIDLPLLAELTSIPVIATTRKIPCSEDLKNALQSAGYPERIPLLEKAGPAHEHGKIYFECAGIEPTDARKLLTDQSGRSLVPESVRLAHLIASGMVLGESRGRV